MRKSALFAALMAVGAAAPVLAAVGTGYTFFGGTTYVTPGNSSNRAAQLTSDATVAYSGINYGVSATLTLAQIDVLSSDYKFDAGSCTLGSPRFQINVIDPNDNTEKNIFAYFGPDSGGTPCVTNGTWANTGDILETGRLLDTSQLGGTFYDPYDSAITKYGNYAVTGIQLVEDSGYAGTAQVVEVDNTNVGGTIYDYEFTSKDDCKNNGWQNFTYAPGPFKNQGQCVSYFARQKN